MESLKTSVKLFLDAQTPRVPYHKRSWDEKKSSIIHWGQRKLLISEIMFLTRYGDLSQTVVYAGSAPGKHIPYLSRLFPQHHFLLVDPNPFQIQASDRIEIYNEYFDDQWASKFAGQNVLFISDMRTADYRQMKPLENEQYIIKDNATQMKWIELMNPIKSMIKFRCPYPDVIRGKTPMYKGLIFIQPWAPPTSTETRLIVDRGAPVIEYDNLEYEQKMFYHNTVARFKSYPQPIRGEGLDDRFDASGEVVILWEYLNRSPPRSMYHAISEMSANISRDITATNRTLASPMKAPENRRHFPTTDHRVFYQHP